MRFVPWYPLAEASKSAPDSAGVYQLKVPSGLRQYPTGKSAMVGYGHATDLASELAELGRADDRNLLCRHAVELTAHQRENLERVLAELLATFERRFGAPPSPAP